MTMKAVQTATVDFCFVEPLDAVPGVVDRLRHHVIVGEQVAGGGDEKSRSERGLRARSGLDHLNHGGVIGEPPKHRGRHFVGCWGLGEAGGTEEDQQGQPERSLPGHRLPRRVQIRMTPQFWPMARYCSGALPGP